MVSSAFALICPEVAFISSAELPSVLAFWAMLERLADTSNTINNTLLARDLTILTRNFVSLRLLRDAICDHHNLLQFIILEKTLSWICWLLLTIHRYAVTHQ